MRFRTPPTLWIALLASVSSAGSLAGQTLSAQQQLAHDIYKELVEINTVSPTGDTGKAADAMAARLHAAGFADADVEVFKPAPRKGNLVARLRGNGTRKPILLLGPFDEKNLADAAGATSCPSFTCRLGRRSIGSPLNCGDLSPFISASTLGLAASACRITRRRL